MNDWIEAERARVACPGCADLAAEVERMRADLDTACRMLAKRSWRGSWDKTPEEWVELGRRMAGLREPPAGDGPPAAAAPSDNITYV